MEEVEPHDLPYTFTIKAFDHGVQIRFLISLEKLTATSPSHKLSTSSSEFASSSMSSPKQKACVNALGISPTSLSLNVADPFHGPWPWFGDDGPNPNPSSSLNPACFTSFTFLLLRASSSCSSRERDREGELMSASLSWC